MLSTGPLAGRQIGRSDHQAQQKFDHPPGPCNGIVSIFGVGEGTCRDVF
ncbi:hypothetical protein PpBr36_02572 [Pyricularia pennisetigena]|nr:hypothetical protein PpBr36_02572 [Pyricularia pennisetigena]TLS31540.1 hypothetical protein PpBr36_02572 [Pyricularia pennisetigena]